MSKKNESTELSAYEKKISELYQSDKKRHAEMPSLNIDADIMAMAKQHLSDHSSLSTNGLLRDSHNTDYQSTKRKSKKAWQGPFSLVASVGLLSILLITQRDYFIHPNNIVAEDAGIISEPVLKSADIMTNEIATEKLEVEPSLQATKMSASTQMQEQHLIKNNEGIARKRGSVNQSAEILEEQLASKSMFGDNVDDMPTMSLLEMSKLANLLRQDQTLVNQLEQETSDSTIRKQQVLFEQLLKYQRAHIDFKITEKYLDVLSEKQIQQLQSFDLDAEPVN